MVLMAEGSGLQASDMLPVAKLRYQFKADPWIFSGLPYPPRAGFVPHPCPQNRRVA